MLGFFLLFFCPLIVTSDPLPYAEWAHYHMVWLPGSHSNQIDIQNMFDAYNSHNIQFGIVNIACWLADELQHIRVQLNEVSNCSKYVR